MCITSTPNFVPSLNEHMSLKCKMFKAPSMLIQSKQKTGRSPKFLVLNSTCSPSKVKFSCKPATKLLTKPELDEFAANMPVENIIIDTASSKVA